MRRSLKRGRRWHQNDGLGRRSARAIFVAYGFGGPLDGAEGGTLEVGANGLAGGGALGVQTAGSSQGSVGLGAGLDGLTHRRKAAQATLMAALSLRAVMNCQRKCAMWVIPSACFERWG